MIRQETLKLKPARITENIRSGGAKTSKVFVATYTNEGLKFQMVLGPLKFEPSKRGRKPLLPIATI